MDNLYIIMLVLHSACMHLCIPLEQVEPCNKKSVKKLPTLNDQSKICVQNSTSATNVEGCLNTTKFNLEVENKLDKGSHDNRSNKTSRKIAVCVFMSVLYMITLFVVTLKELYMSDFTKYRSAKLTSRPPKKEEYEESCAICLENYSSGNLISQLERCKHKFHYDCIATWSEIKPTCPLCRAELNR